MKNPYEHDWLEDEVLVGRTSQKLALGVFLIFILVPALSLLWPSMRPSASSTGAPATLKDRLIELEAKAKTLPLIESWRRADQARASGLLGSGNAKVFAGKDGWLYYRPDLEAVFGKGPFHDEPPSVAREQYDRKWRQAVPVIADFAKQLAERKIRLVFVPVPTKPMVCREGLGLPHGAAAPPALAAVAHDLKSAGIDVVDLLPIIAALGNDTARYLRQDTHWTPGAMEASAREVASRLSTGSGLSPYRVETVARESRGDLVDMLDFGDEAGEVFPPESVTLRRVLNGTSDPNSDVVLLGDSFVNLYEDPELGFAAEGESSIGAGFASHLALALGKPIHTIAINGGGASAVREAFAALPADRLARIKTVVWVVSSRDVLLPEIPARRAGIEWRSVVFNEAKSTDATPASARDLVATLREKSPIVDPTQTPYTSAIYSTVFEAEDGTEHSVFFWAFRDRKLEPAAALEPGRRYRLRLVPLDQDAAANRATRLDDLFRPDLTPVFAESFEAVD